MGAKNITSYGGHRFAMTAKVKTAATGC